jgi:dTDP-4-amino-4,6-dideoxygalactose transaminase
LMTTRDPDIAAHMRRLRNHGSRQRYVHEEFGWNSRLDEIQAAILRVKLPHVTGWNEQRRERATTYGRLIRAAGLAGDKDHMQPTETTPVVLPQSSPGAHHVFHQYVIRAERREALRQHLAKHNIATEIYYPIPLHLQPCLAYLGYREGDLPESERASHQVLALPMFPELSEEEQRRVVASIAEFYS